MNDDNKLKVSMEYLRDKYLNVINDFFKDNENENLMTPISSMIGTVVFLLNMADKNKKFDKEIDSYLKSVLILTHEIGEKILTKNKH